MKPFRPMLAQNSKPEDIQKENYGSLKMEGVRAVFTPEGLLTRNLKPFANERIYERMRTVEEFCVEHGIYLEGEFYVHGWSFNRIDSCLRGSGNIDADQMEVHIFDFYCDAKEDAPFSERIEYYKFAVDDLRGRFGVDHIHAVEQRLMKDADEIRNAYAWAIEHGYEGFCLKAADGPYKKGRSTLKQEYFTRIKPEEDYDCIVLDILERQTNLCESEVNELGYLKKRQDKDMKQGAGMAQSAVVYCPALGSVHKVSLTRGLTDPDRMRIWEERVLWLGTPMTYVGIPVPGQDIPRSPRFDKWRGDLSPSFLVHGESDALVVTWDDSVADDCLVQGLDMVSKERWLELWRQGYSLGKQT
ncbi:MAG: hypothetical protein ACN2B6_12590 [Rickettsiales bacterium]